MKKDLKLIIDSRDAKKTKLELVGPSFTDMALYEGTNTHSQVILPLIEEILKKHDCLVADITAIEVLIDHGSFTGRRVGAVIGAMLGTLLHIPVNGVPAETPVEIPYEEDKWK
jgi:hypothetical protein